jgi:hypothetical protein
VKHENLIGISVGDRYLVVYPHRNPV